MSGVSGQWSAWVYLFSFLFDFARFSQNLVPREFQIDTSISILVHVHIFSRECVLYC